MGKPIAIDGLRGLIFGNGGNGGDTNVLYFTSGPGGETHGLLGSISSTTPIPNPQPFFSWVQVLAGIGLLRKRFKT